MATNKISNQFTVELEGGEITEELVFVVHASVNVHGIVNNTGSMSLATSWQHPKRRHSLPLVGLWVVAPNVVVKELVVCSSETIVRLAT